MTSRSNKLILPLLMMSPLLAHAGPVEEEMLRCSALGDASQRLSCFDALAKASAPTAPNAVVAPIKARPAQQPEDIVKLAEVKEAAPELSQMTQEWELDKAAKRGRFTFRPLRDNYLLLANFSNATNNQPYKDFTPAGIEAKHVELTYQLSFKVKMAEEVAGSPLDIWVGYTQQSFWQAYNRSASSPFRETNYQPEVMAVLPINKNIGGFDIRYVNFGLVHQSNGQTATLSRSWNRVYAELGLERGNFGLTTRVWHRLDNARSDNDNIDIVDYMGHGDIRATYREKNGQEFSLMARRNFSTGHGALQAGWAIPIAANLKGYVQVFDGYGQSLIDYNYSQRSIGAGFLMDF
ncbi:phospholipase A [Undibacterium sp.]|uniref:phospholipase A n=1 Tax=Undibacterium sp. TaxID=1914977 RepID=UPI00374DDCDC